MSGLRKAFLAIALSLAATCVGVCQFVTPPSVVDNRGRDSTISADPNAYDNLAVITFETTGANGDYRVIIDTNGPGGLIEGPDGVFDPNDDWCVTGSLGSPTGQVQRITVTWDGKDKNRKPVKDGTYTARVEIDYLPNGTIDEYVAHYEEVTIKVDSSKPVVLAQARPFSPNGDGSKDSARISYLLSEEVDEVEAELIDPLLPRPPQLGPLGKTGGIEYVIVWDGRDGIGRGLEDGVYTFRIRATDFGGNVGEAEVKVVLDTKPPRLISITPPDLSFLNSPVSEITAQVIDEGEAGLDYESNPPILKLISPLGGEVQGELTVDEAAGKLSFKPKTSLSLPSQNGTYKVELELHDKAGNKLTYSSSFTFDTQPPRVLKAVSGAKTLIPGNPNVVLPREGVIELTVADEGGSGIDFSSLDVKLTGPSQPASFEFETDESSKVTVRYAGLGEEGYYDLEASLSDRAGNRTTVRYRFRYVFSPEGLPAVVAVSPEEGAVVEGELAEVSAALEDRSGAGIDLSSSEIQLLDPSGAIVRGTKRAGDGSTVVYELIRPLGTASPEGVYTISVTPVDKTGTYGLTEEFRFLFTPDLSEKIALSPGDGAYVSSLTSVSAKLDGLLLEWLDKSSCDLTVLRGGSEVPGVSKFEGDALTWKPEPGLRGDGSDDGKYQAVVKLVDKSGKEHRISFGFTLDTQPPQLISLNPLDGSKTSGELTIEVKLADQTSGLDLSATSIRLIGPAGEVQGRSWNDGRSKIWFKPAPLTRPGRYTVELTARDKAGNLLSHASSFDYEILPVELVSIDPKDGSCLRRLESITLAFSDNCDLTETGRRTSLKGPKGEVSAEFEVKDEKLIIRPVEPLSVDGSDDGIYTLQVTPVDAFGNESPARTATYIYDTTEPALESVSYIVDVSDELRINYLKQPFDRIEVKGKDTLSGVDFEKSYLKLLKLEGDQEKEIEGLLGSDRSSRIWLILTRPFAADGSDDGEYRVEVRLVDKAGNWVERKFKLLYDTQPPEVEMDPSPASAVSELNLIKVKLLDPLSGFDPESHIELIGPDGKPIETEKVQTEDGFELKGMSLSRDGSEDGIYTIRVIAKDRAGNQGAERILKIAYIAAPEKGIKVKPEFGSYVSKLLEIEIEGKAGWVDLEKSDLQLLDPKGKPVDGDVRYKEGLLSWQIRNPIPKDGSKDGWYALRVKLMDRLGNAHEVEGKVYFDSQGPEVEVKVKGEGEVEVRVSDEGSGADLLNSSIALIGPEGEVSGKVWSDGFERIFFKPEKLKKAGKYEVRVVARDKAGNETREEIAFDYRPPAPQLFSADPKDGSYLRELKAIRLSFSEGCDLAETGKRVALKGPKGEVPVNAQVEGDEILIHLARKLSSDGSDDGQYILEVTPVDSYGNEGVRAELRYVYDTTEPALESVSYIVDVSDELRINYLKQPFDRIEVKGKDTLSGVDFEKSYLKLLKLEGDQEKEIEGLLGSDRSSRIWLILTRPFAADGSDDGEYRVEVRLVDKAGNWVERKFKLLYDTQPPEAAIEGLEEIYELTPPSKATVRVADGGSGPDLGGTVVRLVGPEGEVPVELENNGIDLITIRLPELKAEGSYRLEVMPKDRAGNSPKNPVQFAFYFVVSPPTVSSASTVVEVKQLSAFGLNYVNSLEGLLITLKGADVSLADSKIEVYGPAGQIPGEIELVEASRQEGWVKVRWSPRMPIARDGSADGSYTVKVTPVDKLGRAGETVEFRLVYDTQKPLIASITHIDLASPVSYLNRSIERMEVTLADKGPSGIDIEGCSFEMLDPSGKPVLGSLTDDGEGKLFWVPASPMATDGSMDGRYVVRVRAIDKAGNALERSFTLIYDTIAPTVQFIEPKGELVTGALTQVVVKFIDPEPGSIDFDASYLKLLDPKGREIEGKLSNDGVSTVKLLFSNPEEEGTYTIKAMAVDKAGNGMGVTFERQFNYSTGLPVVVSTFPKTSPPEEAYTNQQITKVEAVLRETNNGGISFLSQIRLIDPTGNLVPGSQSDNGVDTIIWNLSKPLATDGSDDGLYTITVVPINASGRRGEQLRFTFFYDTVPPEVDLDTLKLITSQTAQNALSEISVAVKDKQPSSGINWDEVDGSWIKLIGPDSKPVPGKATSDKAERLILKLDVPLATDGSQDGRYRIVISPKDRAGNVGGPVEYEFYYDTTPPVIDPSSLTINGKPLELDPNSPDYPTAVSTQSGVTIVARMTDEGVGVDLTSSSIQIFGPKGEPISGTLKQNGVDTLEFRSDMLPEEGIYKVMVKAVGLDAEGLGISPETSISTSFLFEMTKPVAKLTEHGPRTRYENEPAPLRGTASDPPGEKAPPSGVALVEIGGYGPDGEELEWVAAEDESAENEEPWSRWSFDFLPPKSGRYELKIRVTDRAGNYEIYDAVELEFNVSLTFKGPVFAWPNPVSRSKGDVAHFSFELNLAPDERVEAVISIYDVGGDLVWRSNGLTVGPGRNEGELLTWNLRNQFGEKVAQGIYIFKIEATRGDQRAVATGTILVVR